MNCKKDVISSVVLMVFAIVVYVSTYSMTTTVFSEYGATLVPRIVSVLIFCLSSINLLSGLKKQEDGGYIGKNALKQLIASILSLVVYVVLLEKIGFIIMTTLLMFVQMLLISGWDRKYWVKFILISLIVTVFFYFLFTKFFYLVLPQGILF